MTKKLTAGVVIGVFAIGILLGAWVHRYVITPALAPDPGEGALFLSILTGVTSGFIALLLGRVFREWVIPQYLNIIYKGLDISGEWDFRSPHMLQSGKLDLKQDADRLHGTMTLLGDKEYEADYERMRTFSVSGEIANRFILLNARHVETSRLGIGALLLDLGGDGRRMRGYYIFYSVAMSQITFAEVYLYKPGAIRASPQGELALRPPGSFDPDFENNVLEEDDAYLPGQSGYDDDEPPNIT